MIAHEPVKLQGLRDFRNFMPGHNKWDLEYSIGVLQPDVIAPMRWDLPASQESRYEPIRTGDIALLAKRESTNIYWERVERRSGYAPATSSR